jgi:hypothetical protein
VLTLVGLPVRSDGRVYECIAAISAGRLLALMPQKGEKPFCTPPEGWSELTLCGEEVPFGRKILLRSMERPELTIGVDCEALADAEPLAARLTAAGATLVAVPAWGYESLTSRQDRISSAAALSARLHCGLVCSFVGTGETVSDGVCGGQQIICEAGELLACSAPFASPALAEGQLDCTYLEQLRLRARERAQEIRRQAEEDALLEKKKAEEDMKREIADVSALLTGKLLEREVTPEDHRGLIDSFLQELDG